MTTDQLKNWISYFKAANMVAFSEIKTVDDMRDAQRFCRCLRDGVFWNVSAERIWNALCEVAQVGGAGRVGIQKAGLQQLGGGAS